MVDIAECLAVSENASSRVKWHKRVMLLDEISTGLDATTTFDIVNPLEYLARHFKTTTSSSGSSVAMSMNRRANFAFTFAGALVA